MAQSLTGLLVLESTQVETLAGQLTSAARRSSHAMARKKLSPVQATRKSVRSLPPEKFSKAIEEAPIFGRGSYRSSVWPLSLVLCLCVCTLNQTQPLVCCMTASMLPVRDCPHSLRTPDLHVFAYVLCDRILLLNVYSPSPDCTAAHVGDAAATGKSR